METKEHLLNYMLGGNVHLSKKDYGFFNNLQYIIKDNRNITSNQSKLFDKLIIKYQRQIKKNNLDIDHLRKLLWRTQVVDTLPQYLEAHLSINYNKIHIRTPFNNKFIQYLRKLNLNPFVWNKNSKVYEAEYSTYAFKLAVVGVNKFFDNIKFCDTSSQLLAELKSYDTSHYWTPTLVRFGNNFYIVAINESLYNALGDISLNDDPGTLFKLSRYGIDVSKCVIGDDNFKKFASQYETVVDLEDVNTLAHWLNVLKVEQVYTARDIIYNKAVSNEVKTALSNQNLNIKSYLTDVDPGVNVLIKNTTYGFKEIKNIDKIIHLTNSRTINVR